ncbi:hypothetical protein DXV76_08290 [Rhodobacteraceae bacterium CCMM004]|nr:hypothetical protein DXV76_08290 [Rhodobacteraceae bacterium CCMM004]
MAAGALSLAAVAPALASADDMICPPAPEPVYSLAYGSRYADDSATRSDIDADANAEVDEALEPLDDFLRDLADLANTVFEEGTDRRAVSDCVVAQLVTWARADAIADLKSRTANLTVGSRLASFGMVMRQVAPHSTLRRDKREVADWLGRLMLGQMAFWETAPDGARQGNLRAWSALAGAAVADLTGDPVLRGWSAWSVQYILCTATPEGALPQEMARGRLAYHYQLHAVAPLVTAVALLDRHGYRVAERCDGALGRIVDFTVADMETGAATEAITGEVQSYFDGSDQLESFNLAWFEPWLAMTGDARVAALAEDWRPLRHSKLGGNQTLIWGQGD